MADTPNVKVKSLITRYLVILCQHKVFLQIDGPFCSRFPMRLMLAIILIVVVVRGTRPPVEVCRDLLGLDGHHGTQQMVIHTDGG